MNKQTNIRSADYLGAMPDAEFMRNCRSMRVSRAYLLARAQHIELTTLAESAGCRVHVFFRHEVFKFLDDEEILAEEGLYKSLLSMREAMIKAPFHDAPVFFKIGGFTLVARMGQIDHDDPRPAITVSMPSKVED